MPALSFLHRLETLGFYALPAPHSHSPGRSGLLVVLFREASGHLPQSIFLTIKDWDGEIRRVAVDAGNATAGARVFGPGAIDIYSHNEREALFFGFGGVLEAESFPGETIVTLRSTAPLLERALRGSREADLFAEEVIALFARVQAQLNLPDSGWRAALLRAGPLPLYLATLQSLLDQTEHSAALRNAHIDYYATLRHERAWYQSTGNWGDAQPDLPTLLAHNL